MPTFQSHNQGNPLTPEPDLLLLDTRPFPIQAATPYRAKTGQVVYPKRSFIPWWLAEEAYRHYVNIFGSSQSLERIAKRGGFGRAELLALLRQEDPTNRCV